MSSIKNKDGLPASVLPAPIAAVEIDKRVQWQKDAAQKHNKSLRAIAESLQMARETASTISMQSEQLNRTERDVEDAKHAVDMSKRVMRGMTWSGWIANAFSAPPQVERNETALINKEEV